MNYYKVLAVVTTLSFQQHMQAAEMRVSREVRNDLALDRQLWQEILDNRINEIKKLFAPENIPNIPNVNAEDPGHKATALMFASQFDRLPIAEFLIEQGALIDMPSSEGITPLMLAAWMGSPKVAKLLISKGANINARDKHKRTPLIYACWTPKFVHIPKYTDFLNESLKKEVVKLLILAGADVNAQDQDGTTPLMYAVSNNYEDIVALLVKAGANAEIQNIAQKKALDYTVSGNSYIDYFSERAYKSTMEKIIEQAKEAREKHGNSPLEELLKTESTSGSCRIM